MSSATVVCPACGGVGTVAHPDWDRFWAQWQSRRGTLLELQAGVAELWFRERGYSNPPPKRIACEVCADADGIDGGGPGRQN